MLLMQGYIRVTQRFPMGEKTVNVVLAILTVPFGSSHRTPMSIEFTGGADKLQSYFTSERLASLSRLMLKQGRSNYDRQHTKWFRLFARYLQNEISQELGENFQIQVVESLFVKVRKLLS